MIPAPVFLEVAFFVLARTENSDRIYLKMIKYTGGILQRQNERNRQRDGEQRNSCNGYRKDILNKEKETPINLG